MRKLSFVAVMALALALPCAARADAEQYICTIDVVSTSVVQFELTSAPRCGGAPVGWVKLCDAPSRHGCNAGLRGRSVAQWLHTALRVALDGQPFRRALE